MIPAALSFSTRLLPWLIALQASCYREAAWVESPQARLGWAKGFLAAPREGPDGNVACGTLADERAVIARAVARSTRVATFEGEARTLQAASRVSRADAPQLRLDKLRFDRLLDGPGRFELGLRVPFARPGTLAAASDEQQLEAQAAQARADEEAREVALAVRLALARHQGWKALAGLARVEHAAARAEAARLSAGQARAEVTAAELALAQLAELQAEGELARADAEAARWLALLTSYLGAGCALALPEAPAEPPTGERDALVDAALAERPSMRLFAARAGMASARGWEARAAAWPWLAFAQVGYELVDDPSPYTWTLSLAVDLPIGAWGGAAGRAAAAEERAAEGAAGREANAIAAEVDAALAEVAARQGELEALTGALGRFDAERRANLERGAKEGHVDPAVLRRIDRELQQLERQRLEARLDLAEARARMLAALGR